MQLLLLVPGVAVNEDIELPKGFMLLLKDSDFLVVAAGKGDDSAVLEPDEDFRFRK